MKGLIIPFDLKNEEFIEQFFNKKSNNTKQINLIHSYVFDQKYSSNMHPLIRKLSFNKNDISSIFSAGLSNIINPIFEV